MNEVKERFAAWVLRRTGELPKDSHAWDYRSIKTFLLVFDGLKLVPEDTVAEEASSLLEQDRITDLEKRVTALENSYSYLNAQFNAATRLLKERA